MSESRHPLHSLLGCATFAAGYLGDIMHTIVKIFGALIALIGLAVAIFGISAAQDSVTAGFTIVASAFGVIVTGALFWCFGAIVEHLIAIRRALETKA